MSLVIFAVDVRYMI